MEKRTSHYDLEQIKKLLDNESTRKITEQAIDGAATLGYLTIEDMLDVVDRLRRRHLYKSMTVHGNSKLWQDVYKIADEGNDLYIKLQMDEAGERAVLVQFKRDEGGDA